MPHITIRFINGSGFVSKAIDWVTNSLWCHVEIMTERGTWVGAHAGTGIQERAADWTKPTSERQYAIPVTQEEYDLIQARIKEDTGKPYNYGTVAGIFLHNRELNQDGRYDCSQWVTDLFIAGGVWLLNCEPGFTYLITPTDLHKSCKLMNHCVYKLG